MHHNLPQWHYFRLLERDLDQCFEYIHPSPSHYSVYSDRFARIILIACSEIENCLNSFAREAKFKPKPSTIGKYQEFIAATCPLLVTMKIDVPRYSIELTPWEGWTKNSAPDWWTLGYNKIKHDRVNHVAAPTLIRALTSVAALLALLLHYYHQLHGPDCQMPADIFPSLLMPHEEDDGIYGPAMGWVWRLPGE